MELYRIAVLIGEHEKVGLVQIEFGDRGEKPRAVAGLPHTAKARFRLAFRSAAIAGVGILVVANLVSDDEPVSANLATDARFSVARVATLDGTIRVASIGGGAVAIIAGLLVRDLPVAAGSGLDDLPAANSTSPTNLAPRTALRTNPGVTAAPTADARFAA